MIEITGLTQVQNTFKGAGSGEKSALLPKSDAGKALLPSDQIIQQDASTHVAQDALPAETSQRIDIFVVRDNVFSLYKLPNGELFSKVRNLKTGEEKVFPSIDSLSYFEAIRGNRGMFIEKEV